MAAPPAADAASGKQRTPQRVQQVLEYLQSHPMTITSLPMQYDADSTVPLPDCIAGLQPADVLPTSSSSSSSTGREHMARVIAGLLYVACGGLDAAHNLVTPLCWGSWTPYAGKPVASSPAAAEAAFVHALIHRQEGQCIGEFGSGFSNANYWYRAAGQHPINAALLKEARKLAAGNAAAEAHVAKHGSSWVPSKFVGLCCEVAERRDPQLLKFCEGVMAAEMRLLLDYCYQQL
uniref:Uncharacterized protein n=1 Tax=Tetradesmus obliquus TaxID=3088 RepID=A0A383W348_TETOB|eukprot:jgi/Sobl393_1/4717/SZX71542.1